MTAVKVFGRQAENFKPGRQPEAHQHLVAAVIAPVYNFSIFNQVKILLSSSANALPLGLLKWQRAKRIAHRVEKIEEVLHSFSALPYAPCAMRYLRLETH
jgi:hypothetical protein